MTRRTDQNAWANHPELTMIKSPWEKYRKTDWNFSQYEDAVFARPCNAETVMYAALDFCVSVVSLRDWTRRTLVRDVDPGQERSGFVFWAPAPLFRLTVDPRLAGAHLVSGIRTPKRKSRRRFRGAAARREHYRDSGCLDQAPRHGWKQSARCKLWLRRVELLAVHPLCGMAGRRMPYTRAYRGSRAPTPVKPRPPYAGEK
jgi:hypothetical protein